ncbi:MAG: rhodanese-like domain-containing protein [Dehalococcoidia bacterium]
MTTIDPNVEPYDRLTPAQAEERVQSGTAALIDVREDDEWNAGHAKSARHLPLNELIAAPQSLPEGQDLVFICESGNRSALAAEYLAAIGREGLANVEGGTEAWRAAGRPMA